MLPPTLLALFAPLLLLPSTLALPSRTHCRCTITPPSSSDSLPQTPFTDSPLDTESLLASPSSLCAALGPALEAMRGVDPALYASYMSKTDTQAADGTLAETPIPTTVLLRMGATRGLGDLGVLSSAGLRAEAQANLENESGNEEKEGMQRVRIECGAERKTGSEERWTVYEVSWVTLVVLQVVVALVVVACVAEGLMLGMKWMSTSAPSASHRQPPHLRLSGEEKRLLAVPSSDRLDMRSPGAEKKLRVYASHGWKVERFNFEKEEDEVTRSVM